MVTTRRGAANNRADDQPSTSRDSNNPAADQPSTSRGSNNPAADQPSTSRGTNNPAGDRPSTSRDSGTKKRKRTRTPGPPAKRKPGRPKRRGVTGGVRAGAGRKTNKSKNLGVGRRRVNQVASKLKDSITHDSDYDILRKAFLKAVKDRFSDAVWNIVDAVTKPEFTPWAEHIWKNREFKEPEPLDKRESLALLLTAGLSKHDYTLVADTVNKAAKVKLLKHYNTVRKCKIECIPEGLTVTETSAEVPLQGLVNHTISRTVEAYMSRIDKKLENMNDNETMRATFTFCYGGDSATGYRMYNMRYSGNNNEESSDSSLFAAVINPISLNADDGTTLWKNSNPQSASSVRPIFHEWERETPEYVRGFIRRLREAVENLEPTTVVTRAGKRICVHTRFFFTLIDGKVFNIITETSSHQCPTCGRGRAAINDVSNIGGPLFEPQGNGLSHGAQVMHAWLKLFQDLWKIALNKPVREAMRRFQDEGVEFVPSVVRAAAKRRMQQAFKAHGLRVDMPNQFGTGNTLNGNMARRIFRNRDIMAGILDVQQDLVERYYVILCVLNNTRYMPKRKEFYNYCITTLRYRMDEYRYVSISPSLHKILVHSADITHHIGIPPGVSSEGAAEASHRYRKIGKDRHTRKTGRTPGNHDLICYELCRTDPVISRQAGKIAKKYREARRRALEETLPAAAVELLIIPDDSDDSDDDDDDSGLGESCQGVDQVPNGGSEPTEARAQHNENQGNDQEFEIPEGIDEDEGGIGSEGSGDEENSAEASDQEEDEGNETNGADLSDNDATGTESEADESDDTATDNAETQSDIDEHEHSVSPNESIENNAESDVDEVEGDDAFGGVEDSDNESGEDEDEQEDDNAVCSDDEFEARFLADHFDDEPNNA